ncbi:Flavoredoxin [Caloramator mitchellensis]|uniref:Flavoredoxin n=1 Tax=Caloramator mitchellensis TaxID=908809 RepID=A0A0R3JUS1_CALMK|nr:flavin reductase family protein [Caloramator mitchellensis]KRQ87323.1 Flavoredoxin [Caloramator mitchellensis]
MARMIWKPGTMLYPVPAALITSKYEDKENIITISWIGTVCSEPPMLSISVRPERYSYELIKKSGEFVVNIPNKDIAFATDYCGVKSGREVDKFKILNLTKEKASKVEASIIKECPLALECKVKQILELGTHHMFIAEVVAVNVDEKYMDENGKLHLDKANLLMYNHGKYAVTGEHIGKFGFSVEKKKK